MRKTLLGLAFVLAVVTVLFFLYGPDLKKARQIRALIAAELHEGANSEEIEYFYKRHKIIYSYDRFQKRYHGIIRNVSSFLDQAVEVDIYVDEQKQFVRAEIHDSFTGP